MLQMWKSGPLHKRLPGGDMLQVIIGGAAIYFKAAGKLQLTGMKGRMPVRGNGTPRILPIRNFSRTDDSLTIEGKVDDQKITITFDTGATRTIVRSGVVKGKRIEPLSQNLQLRTVTGETAAVMGEVKVNLQLGSFRLEPRILVADIEDEFILGMDLIRQYGLSFDSQLNTLRFGNEEFVLSRGTEEPIIRIRAVKTIRVPSCTEKIILGRLEKNPGSCVGLVEQLDSTNKYLVAKTLIHTSCDIPIRIANIFPNSVLIKEGDVIGTCAPVNQVTRCEEESQKELKTSTSAILEKFQSSWDHLSPTERKMARKFVVDEANIFESDDGRTGRTDLIKHRIDTGHAYPIRQPPRRVPFAKQQEVEHLVEKMLEEGVIEESSSPWSAPVVLVTKKDGTSRFCVDYRKLNDVTRRDTYPLPRIDDTLTTLAGSKWFSTLDLKSGYWQVGIHDDDKEKTAFSTSSGLYHFTVMPFGLCNAPATFERLMEMVLRGLTWKTCLVYLDDVMVMGRSFEEHLANLGEVFKRIRNAHLRLNPKKCSLFQKKVEFLGHVVSPEGIHTDQRKIQAVRDWPRPQDKHELRSFLGLCTYYRRFVEGFANVAAPLHKLTEDKATYNWSGECDVAFRRLKSALCSSPVLAYPQTKGKFILDTDARNTCIGAVLSQEQDGEERVIDYFSRVLTKPERNYCVTRKELLAIVKAVDHFHKYLYGREFLVRTDHAALKWLLEMKNPEGQIARWMEKLQQYHFKVKHRPGRINDFFNACLSRPCKERCGACVRGEPREGNAMRRTRIEVDPEWTSEQLRADQLADPDIGPILHLIEEGLPRPSWQEA